jgi:hypothetical protein
MAKLHHVSSHVVLASRAPSREPVPAPAWRPVRPRTEGGVQPWFLLTPENPSADTHVATGTGVVATLETFGGITGPAGEDASDRATVILGGALVAPGSPAPADRHAFSRACVVRLNVRAAELGFDRQCLLVFGLRAEGDAGVQSFIGTSLIAEDTLAGEERLAFAIDADDDVDLEFELHLRLCGLDSSVRLGVRGVVGYLL